MDLQMLGNPGLIQVGLTLLVVILIYNGLHNLINKVKEKPSKPTATRRRLGKHEGMMNMFSEEREGSSDIFLILSLRYETKLVKEYVHNALVLLAKRQPMLRAIIRTSTLSTSDNKEKSFEIIDGDQISDMVDFTSSDVKACAWQDVYHEVASRKQRATGLLWKAVILQEEFLSEEHCYTNTLIFTFKHCCIDGVSSVKFCQQFLYYLNGLADGSLTSDKVVPSLSFCPSFIELLTRKRPWSLLQFLATCLGIPLITKFICQTTIRWMQYSKKVNPFFVQFPPDPKPSPSPMTKILFKVFTETETSNIVKTCRLNGCTVTGAMTAAIHLAFCKCIQDGEHSFKNVQLQYDIAINVKPQCQPKPPEEYLGHFAHCQPIFIPCVDKEAEFWKAAQESTKRIHYELKDEKYAKEIVTILDCFNTEEILNDLISPLERQKLIGLSSCNCVSSAGSFDFRDEEKSHRYRLHECLFYNLVHGFPNSFMHFNTTVNGKMSWVIAYDPSKVVNGAHAQRLANLCFEYFVQMNE